MGVEENDSEWIELKNNWHALCSKKSKKANAQDFVTQIVKNHDDVLQKRIKTRHGSEL